jgi:hypothetical protein
MTIPLLCFIILFTIPWQSFSVTDEGCWTKFKRSVCCGKEAVRIARPDFNDLGLIEQVRWVQRNLRSGLKKTSLSVKALAGLDEALHGPRLYSVKEPPHVFSQWVKAVDPIIERFDENAIEALRQTLILFEGAIRPSYFARIDILEDHMKGCGEFVSKEDERNRIFENSIMACIEVLSPTSVSRRRADSWEPAPFLSSFMG